MPRGLLESTMLQRMNTESDPHNTISRLLNEFLILGCSMMLMETRLPVKPKRANTGVATPFAQKRHLCAV